MENDPENCTYYMKNGTLHVPDGVKCVTGGHVMISFFSVLFGGLNLGQAFPALSAMVSGKLELGKIFQIIRNIPILDSTSTEGQVLDNIEGRVQLKDVTFAYPQRPEHNVYKNINLNIEAGQTVALVGPSGCGKSTAVQLIERFYDPADGSVQLDGVDIKSLRLSWLRQQIGLVS
jgi:ABC-type multidrug transport system fused ATPase/permease subunit